MVALPPDELKLCKGPTHPNAVYLPLTEEYWNFRRSDSGYYKEGTPYTVCKLCKTYMKYGPDGGLVECKPIRPFLQELLRRYDNNYEQTANCIGISDQSVRNILGTTNQCTIQRATAKKIILALDNKRREDRRNGSVAPAFIYARKMQERVERMAGY